MIFHAPPRIFPSTVYARVGVVAVITTDGDIADRLAVRAPAQRRVSLGLHGHSQSRAEVREVNMLSVSAAKVKLRTPQLPWMKTPGRSR